MIHFLYFFWLKQLNIGYNAYTNVTTKHRGIFEGVFDQKIIGLNKKKGLYLEKILKFFFLCAITSFNGSPLKIWLNIRLHAKFGLWKPTRSRDMIFWKSNTFSKNGYFSKFCLFFIAKLGNSAANRAKSQLSLIKRS